MSCFLRPFLLIAGSLAAAAGLHAVHEQTWLSAVSPVTGDITKVVFGGGSFVALASESQSQDATRIIRSDDGVHWDGVWFEGDQPLKDIAFGAGRFLMVAGPLGVEPARVLVSEDGRDWSVAASFDEGDPVGVTYAKDGFWVVMSTTRYYWSRGDSQWIRAGGGPPGAPAAFGEDILVAFGGSGVWRATLGEGGSSYGLTARQLAGPVTGVAVGPDRVVALAQAKEGGTLFGVSGDGSLWMALEHRPTESFHSIVNVNETFWVLGSGMRGQRIALSSEDGVRWADRSEGLGGASLRSMATGKGMFGCSRR